MTSEEAPQPETPENEDSKQDSAPSGWARAAVFGAIGFELVGFTVGGMFIGQFIDEKLGTTPLGFLVGLIAGLAAAGVHIWKMSERFLSETSSSERSSDG